MASQNNITRKLIQGSSSKKDRMMFADPSDHSFNNTAKFTDRHTSPYIISNKKSQNSMPPIKNHLPRVSPLNADEEDELITVLKDVITHERELEESKIRLAQ